MKLSNKLKKTFEFYRTFPKMLDVADHELPKEDLQNGSSALVCFWNLENGIKTIKTNQYDLLKRVIEGKKSVNLQIKLWAEDIGVLLMPSELQKYCKDMPSWVYDATIKQAQKRYLQEVGFIPTFLKA